jgi:hypothetical protein
MFRASIGRACRNRERRSLRAAAFFVGGLRRGPLAVACRKSLPMANRLLRRNT